MLLRRRYAMCSTEIGYASDVGHAATDLGYATTGLDYATTRCPIRLCCYAMCGTELVYDGMSGTELYRRYGMSGTELRLCCYQASRTASPPPRAKMTQSAY
eukprot:3063414-Rhodomonas_salina.2